MKNDFDKSGFMEYLGLTDSFSCKVIENIINYAETHKSFSKDQFVYFVSHLLPNVEFREVAAFMRDSKLTTYGISEKLSFWRNKLNCVAEV